MASTAASPTITGARLLVTVLVLGAVVAAAVAHVEAASVSVSWPAPTTNADGTSLSDLAGYRIYLGTSLPPCPGASFHAVSAPATTPASGETVSTTVTALIPGTTYFARVTAVDRNGNESTCSSSASGVAQPDFTVAPSATTSFGSLTVGATVDRTFTVQNTSSAGISGAASVGAPFSIVSGSSFSLAPGASQTVTVRFRPITVGSFAGNVTFAAGSDSVSRAVSGASIAGATATLSVAKNGPGAGTVTSSPAGIACGTDCTETVAAGTRITLSAGAASGSVFAGWSGACSGTATCAVTVNAATSVTATFNASSTAPPAPGVLPVPPGTPSVTQLVADASGVRFAIAWAPAIGATAYGYAAAFTDGSASQQDTVTAPSLQLQMPYHVSGAASGGFVCIRSVSATGQQSTDQSCSAVPVPARPAGSSVPAVPVAGSLSPASAAAGSAGLTLTVNGSRFVASSVVRWNGAARTTTFVSANQLRAAIAASDLATARSVPVSVFTPSPGGGTSGTVTFTVTAPAGPLPAPGAPSVTRTAVDGTGVTFTVAWGAVSGATSYGYVAAFNDGSASRQGTVTARSFQLRMPYHASGAAFGASVCIRSVSATGQQSTNQSCSAVPVPARPVAPPPAALPPPPPPPPADYGWGVG